MRWSSTWQLILCSFATLGCCSLAGSLRWQEGRCRSQYVFNFPNSIQHSTHCRKKKRHTHTFFDSHDRHCDATHATLFHHETIVLNAFI